MKYHGVRSLGARQVLTRLEPEEASLYFAGASGPIFPGRKCLAYAWSVTRDSRIVGPEAEDPGGGGVEQRPCQLARSYFRSLIEKLVRISVLVDQNSIWARRSLPVCLSLSLSLTLSLCLSLLVRPRVTSAENEGVSVRVEGIRHLGPSLETPVSTLYEVLTTVELLESLPFTCWGWRNTLIYRESSSVGH